MFEDFLYLLRRNGLRVSLTEWMALMDPFSHNTGIVIRRRGKQLIDNHKQKSLPVYGGCHDICQPLQFFLQLSPSCLHAFFYAKMCQKHREYRTSRPISENTSLR